MNGHQCLTLCDIVAIVQHKLNLWALSTIQIVVDIDIGLELKIVAHNLLAPLSERAFHVVVGSKSHHTPKGLLYSGVSHPDGVVDAVSAPLAIGLVLVPECIRHLTRKNIIGVNIGKFY